VFPLTLNVCTMYLTRKNGAIEFCEQFHILSFEEINSCCDVVF